MKVAELLLKYKTDKNHGTIKNIYDNLDSWRISENAEPSIGHTYGASYDAIFENFDKSYNIDFLEIGIQKGGSLLAWKDYFPNGNIYGVDITDCILEEYRQPYFNYIISDIKSDIVKEKLKDVMFDIIIDDGSHALSDVMFVVSNYLSKLKPGGFMIIEDCQQPEYWLQQIRNTTPLGYDISIRDLRGGELNGSYDNFLIVIQKNKL